MTKKRFLEGALKGVLKSTNQTPFFASTSTAILEMNFLIRSGCICIVKSLKCPSHLYFEILSILTSAIFKDGHTGKKWSLYKMLLAFFLSGPDFEKVSH